MTESSPAAAEGKVKSPPHQRRLFGWRKTWTPEKADAEKQIESLTDFNVLELKVLPKFIL